MFDFQTAYKARLPFISVHTDDPLNVKRVLAHWAGKSVARMPTAKETVGDLYLFWTEDTSVVTVDNYKRLNEAHASCAVVNPDKPSMLVYDTGTLQTPTEFYVNDLKEYVEPEHMTAVVQQLKGLSVKTAQEVVRLTMARVQSVAPHELRKTRQMMGGATPGLTQIDTDFDFYEWPLDLKAWLDLNESYFLNLNTPQQLVPRGFMLAGDRGVGKSMAAKALAKYWDVPLFRLDVSTSLNRFLGESESRIARNLALIEQNAPCIGLLDEVEKLFITGADEGTTQRILSQFLWWLQEHRSRVFTVMTTNDLKSIPEELYRAERLDKVIHLGKLSSSAARAFAFRVYESIMKEAPPLKHAKVLRETLEQADKPSHAELRVIVYDLIKSHKWLIKDPA